MTQNRMSDHETIQWRSWDAEAFRQAEETGKPIFLSISASWCHWCHVMDEESFTHPEAIRRINADFIPIRVDSDKRPDINSRYNMGGWPTVAILNPEGEMIIGDTYLPLPQLLAMLSSARKESKENRQRSLKQKPEVSAQPQRINESLVQTVAGCLSRVFDPHFGGFGGPPKFPQPWAIELAFHLNRRTGDSNWLEMAALTLDNMREGAIYDPIDGGFFRYATRGDWDNPHFEKLLETNARMLSLYLKAYHLTGQATYRVTAQGVLDYLLLSLAVPGQAWFCGSQSADSDYYTQSEEERTWEDPPRLDQTIYTNCNAMVASGLLSACHVLGDIKYRDAAQKLIDFLWGQCYQAGQGMFHYREGTDGKLSLPGYLSDQVYMMMALMDAFEATGSRSYLDRAEDLAKVMDDHLRDHQQGGYWDLPADGGAQGVLKVRIKPFTENAVGAMALTRLYHLTGREIYQRYAEAVLGYLATVFMAYKHHAAPFAVAVERFLEPPHHVTVVGKRGEARWTELLEAAHRLKSLWKAVLPLDAEEDGERLRSLGYPPSHETLAYLCVGKTCLPPLSRPEDLARAIT